jgi:UDP-N-acetylglucosamine transferase subunit ALG13
MDRAEYTRRLREADAVVSHAGMGTIIQCQDEDKPLLVLPRRSALGECINDHQFSMARKLDQMGLIQVAYAEQDLPAGLDTLLQHSATGRKQDQRAGLVDRISMFISTIDRRRRGA